MLKINICLLIAVSCIIACSEKRTFEKNGIAVINGEIISLSELDESVKHQLHERLYDIYKIREIALNKTIERKLLNLESNARGINVDSLLKIEIDAKVNEENILKFIAHNGLEDGIAPPDDPFKLIGLNSEYGKQLLIDTYKSYLKDELIERLKILYNVSTNLRPPQAPAIDLDLVKYPIIAAEDESIELNYIADLDCEFSRQSYPLVRKVIDEYPGRINLNFIPINSEVTYSSMVASMANEAGKFSVLMDLVCKQSPADSSDYNILLQQIGISPEGVINHYTRHATSLRETFIKLHHDKITVTPTLVIEGRPYYGMITYDHLNAHLKQVLSR